MKLWQMVRKLVALPIANGSLSPISAVRLAHPGHVWDLSVPETGSDDGKRLPFQCITVAMPRFACPYL